MENAEIAPPWDYMDEHPCSIGWRMGGGEGYVMRWGEWWDAQNWDETARIAYFQKWMPPPRWLAWTATAIWDLEPWESGDSESFDYAPYFARLAPLGFPTQADYERDFSAEDGEE